MLILQINKELGASIATRELTSALIGRGVDVNIIAEDGRYPPSGHLNGLNLYLPSYLLKYVEMSVKAPSLLDPNDFDLIHSHQGLIMSKLLMTNSKSPWVHTVHSTYLDDIRYFKEHPLNGLDRLKYIFGIKTERLIHLSVVKQLRRKVFFIAVSSRINAELRALGVPDDRIFVVPNGVNIRFFNSLGAEECRARVMKQIGLPEDSRIVFSAGYISPIKGIHVVIRAIPAILKAVRNVQFVAAGSHPFLSYTRYLNSLARRLGVQERVHFLGPIKYASIPMYFKACDLFVQASFSEGSPLTVPQAMACKKPLVVTETCAPEDYGIADCAVAIGDYGVLAEKISFYLNNEEEARKLTNRNYQLAQSRLSWNKLIERYIESYKIIKDAS